MTLILLTCLQLNCTGSKYSIHKQEVVWDFYGMITMSENVSVSAYRGIGCYAVLNIIISHSDP